jgi:anti-sigma B factor antagonist
MNVTKTVSNNNCVFAVEGRIDSVTSPMLDQAVKEVTDKTDSITINFANVDYLSSAGLRVLLSLHKIMSTKGGMKITNVNENIMEIFEVTGFDEILDID